MADLEVRRFDLDDDGQQLNVTVEVHNTSDRTLLFYRDVRGVSYDDASKTLRLLLTDRHRRVTEGPIGVASMRPPLKAVDPGESETISLRLPRFVTKLGPEQPGKPGPTLKDLPVHEAALVEAEISWSDKPFYPEPKSRRSATEQLRRWERGALKVRMDRHGPAPPPEATPPKRPRRK